MRGSRVHSLDPPVTQDLGYVDGERGEHPADNTASVHDARAVSFVRNMELPSGNATGRERGTYHGLASTICLYSSS